MQGSPLRLPRVLLLSICRENWKGPLGLLKNAYCFLEDRAPEQSGEKPGAPRGRRPARPAREARLLTKRCLHSRNCLVMAAGVIALPGRGQPKGAVYLC